MIEKVQRYVVDHKDGIKTGVILVLAPIALLGLMATKGLNDIAHFLSTAADSAIKESK